MGATEYSARLCRELEEKAEAVPLRFRRSPIRRETGETIRTTLTGLWPPVKVGAEIHLEKFVGGGFAGQVYRCEIKSLKPEGAGGIDGLRVGERYALKILSPPSQFSRWFRDVIYKLGYQAPFSARVNEAACRSGLMWQRLIRLGARAVFGRDDAVKRAHAYFWDERVRAFAEITEWMEGRSWLLETDAKLWRRRHWRTIDLNETGSAEFIAKRRFMARMVTLLHDMGMPEFGRQYEWWTMKSQPNTMKRTSPGADDSPEGGLCAIDFRAGLALLPFLPMSPGDVKLIWDGLFKRGALVQFDRSDFARLDQFVENHPEAFADAGPMIEELRRLNRSYRRSMPDVTAQGIRLLTDRDLRRDARSGMIDANLALGVVDDDFAERLRGGNIAFTLFLGLGLIPVLGPWLRQLWGNRSFRQHYAALVGKPDYLRGAIREKTFRELIEWHRQGRIGEQRCRALTDHPWRFLVECAAVKLCPFAAIALALATGVGAGSRLEFWEFGGGSSWILAVMALTTLATAIVGFSPKGHRAVTEPGFLLGGIKASFGFMRVFFIDPAFRERYFLDMLAAGEKEGMLTTEERGEIAAKVNDPFIVKYLKCLGVHFATLPVTQIVSLVAGIVLAGWLLAKGSTWEKATLAFAATLAFFQVFPISPGSICRGGFVLYLMIKERNLRDYVVAAPVSFLKYVGYLAFPLQMTTSYPRLARFLAGRWASAAVHFIPVFGEKGALLEHWVFDLFFNVPQTLGGWARRRLKPLLTGWMIIGIATGITLYAACDLRAWSVAGVNLILVVICLFVLPWAAFLLHSRRGN